MAALSRTAETRNRALRHLRLLAAHPDPIVQTTAREAEADLAAMPAGLDEYLHKMAPPGLEVARVQIRLVGVPVLGTGDESGLDVYRFRRPAALHVVRDGEYFVAFSPPFLVHSTGDTVEDAIRHFLDEWLNHYRLLLEGEQRGQLGTPLQRELARIRRALRPAAQPERVALVGMA